MKTIALIRSAFVGLAIAFADFHAHGAQEPLFEGLGSYKRKVTTDSPKAQRYFNQGLAFLQGLQSWRSDSLISRSSAPGS